MENTPAVTAVTDRLHRIVFPVGQCYVWRDDDGLTLVDSGPPGAAPAIAAAIRTLGHHPADVRRLVLTHFHADHVGGAAEIVSWGTVAVVAHRAEAAILGGAQAGPPPRFEQWELPIFEQVSAAMPAQPPAPVRVTHPVEEGDVVDVGGGARVLSVPGHTDGSIALLLEQAGVLFTGDTVARGPDGRVIRGVFNLDSEQTSASLLRLAGLDLDVACFGHGDPSIGTATTELRLAVKRLAEPPWSTASSSAR